MNKVYERFVSGSLKNHRTAKRHRTAGVVYEISKDDNDYWYAFAYGLGQLPSWPSSGYLQACWDAEEYIIAHPELARKQMNRVARFLGERGGVTSAALFTKTLNERELARLDQAIDRGGY